MLLYNFLCNFHQNVETCSGTFNCTRQTAPRGIDAIGHRCARSQASWNGNVILFKSWSRGSFGFLAGVSIKQKLIIGASQRSPHPWQCSDDEPQQYSSHKHQWKHLFPGDVLVSLVFELNQSPSTTFRVCGACCRQIMNWHAIDWWKHLTKSSAK